MYVVYNGHVCVMVWNDKKSKWEYIPEEQYKKEV